MTPIDAKITTAPGGGASALAVTIPTTPTLNTVHRLQQYALEAGQSVTTAPGRNGAVEVRVSLPEVALVPYLQFLMGLTALLAPQSFDDTWTEIRAAGNAALGRDRGHDD